MSSLRQENIQKRHYLRFSMKLNKPCGNRGELPWAHQSIESERNARVKLPRLDVAWLCGPVLSVLLVCCQRLSCVLSQCMASVVGVLLCC